MGMDSHLLCWGKFLDAVTSLGLTDPHLILSHFSSFIFSNARSVVCYQSLVKWRQVFGFHPQDFVVSSGKQYSSEEVLRACNPLKIPRCYLVRMFQK